MKCLLLTFFILFVFPTVASAQESSSPHYQTTPAATARYELVQSSLIARWTFRLDRFSGRVALLVKTMDDANTWQDMPVVGLPTIANPSSPRFQLFTSGIAARHTYLIDGQNGKTWMIVSVVQSAADGSQYETYEWQPFAE